MTVAAGFNRTFMELKVRTFLTQISVLIQGFNRTFMELKDKPDVLSLFRTDGFNRTFMELKDEWKCQTCCAQGFQSHLYGIERRC